LGIIFNLCGSYVVKRKEKSHREGNYISQPWFSPFPVRCLVRHPHNTLLPLLCTWPFNHPASSFTLKWGQLWGEFVCNLPNPCSHTRPWGSLSL
jgi:hypothetical protein